MERRFFFKALGGLSTAAIVFPVVASFGSAEMDILPCDNEEFKKALQKHFRKVFYTPPDSDNLAPKGRYFFAESFSIEVNSQKNTIFDLAEEAIRKAKECGFDASSLREGKIPEGMQIDHGGFILRKDNSIVVTKLDGLKNWDASVIFHNCINILSSVPPSEWHKLDKIEPLSVGRGYSGNLSGPFKIWIGNDSESKFNVEKITPEVVFENNEAINPTHSNETLKKNLSKSIVDKILI